MTRAQLREAARRKLRQARRLFDAADDHLSIAREMDAEARRLCDEVVERAKPADGPCRRSQRRVTGLTRSKPRFKPA